MNLDQRSVRLNTEMGLLIDSGSLADEVAMRFNRLTQPEEANEVSLKDGQHRATPRWSGKHRSTAFP